MNTETANKIIESIELNHQKIRTKSIDMSFNELMDMHANKELKIDPDFQRLFQWSEAARSRFIESLLLELPIPPIYVVEDKENSYELIDGLQRLSSYLHFRGALNAPHLGIKLGNYLALEGCDIVPELNELTWEDLPPALKIRLKRSFVTVQVVAQGSDPRTKFHMFNRLNTGGQLLSRQNVRNCTIRLLDPKINEFVVSLSRVPEYENCTTILTDDQRLQAFDQALVLRFLAFKNWRVAFKHEVDDFLDSYMFKVAAGELGFDFRQEEMIFQKTFAVLGNSLGELAFAQPSARGSGLARGFSVYHFEAITVGMQTHLKKFDPNDKAQMHTLKRALIALKLDGKFRAMTTGGGRNSPGSLRKRIEFVSKAIEAVL